MSPPVPLPVDVQTWLRSAFQGCNEKVSAVLSRVPTSHEVALDMAFIDHFGSIAAPVQFSSGWVVENSTHFLGGGRHIGFLVLFRQGGKLLRSKVALLQSKRLYPDELDWDEDSPLDYMAGFGRLMREDDEWSTVTAPRPFSFRLESRYQSLVSGVNQYKAIALYETSNQIPVYYLLYNPWQLPHTVTFPLTAGSQVTGSCDVGCRIVPAQQLRTALEGKPEGRSPAYADLCHDLAVPFTNPQAPGRMAPGALRRRPAAGVRDRVCRQRTERPRTQLHLQPPGRADIRRTGSHDRRAVRRIASPRL